MSRPGKVARIVLWTLYWYQQKISPLFGPRCRYFPTCSSYAVEAVQTHGATKGILLSSWRLLRCNPLSNGGIDHVPGLGKWPWHSETSRPRYAENLLATEFSCAREDKNKAVLSPEKCCQPPGSGGNRKRKK